MLFVHSLRLLGRTSLSTCSTRLNDLAASGFDLFGCVRVNPRIKSYQTESNVCRRRKTLARCCVCVFVSITKLSCIVSEHAYTNIVIMKYTYVHSNCFVCLHYKVNVTSNTHVQYVNTQYVNTSYYTLWSNGCELCAIVGIF